MITEEKRYSNTAYMALCGLFAALTVVCTYISIPLGFTPVPVNLATLAVFMAGGILGMKYGTISLIVYVLLGAVDFRYSQISAEAPECWQALREDI